MKRRYLLVTWSGISAELLGPFTTDEERDAKAAQIRYEDDENGVHMLDAHGLDDHATLEVLDYSGGEIERLIALIDGE